MALWHSLETTEQEQALTVDAGLSTELERRWAEHQQHPERAVSWDVVRQDLGLAIGCRATRSRTVGSSVRRRLKRNGRL
ncbi:MAG: addiction module protein [Cyanobacteria bacterium]|nr:addiction module protein [Cyanobacteriota bacterium]